MSASAARAMTVCAAGGSLLFTPPGLVAVDVDEDLLRHVARIGRAEAQARIVKLGVDRFPVVPRRGIVFRVGAQQPQLALEQRANRLELRPRAEAAAEPWKI